MAEPVDSLPDDVETLKAMVIATRVTACNAEADAYALRLQIEKMKFEIARLRHEQYGASTERGAHLEQLTLHLAELEDTTSQSETAAQIAASAAARENIVVAAFERKRPARRPLPDHLRRERIVYDAPKACSACGGEELRKLGEDVTEMLEAMPRQWKVIQHVREKFSCRKCEAISQTPAPSHPMPRGRHLLAQVLFGKYGLHLPLNRQSATYAREGIDLDVSTLADLGGSGRGHADAARRSDAETCVCCRADPCRRHPGPGFSEGKGAHRSIVDLCARRRAVRWSYSTASGVLLFARPVGDTSSRTSGRLHRFDAGRCLCRVNRLYEASRKPGPIIEPACWAQARRKYFDLARLTKAPIAIEAVRRIDGLFLIEREIRGLVPQDRLAVRQERTRPLLLEFENWLRQQRAKLSSKSETARAIDYGLKVRTRWRPPGRIRIVRRIFVSVSTR